MSNGMIKKKLINVYEKIYVYKMHLDDYRVRKRVGSPKIMTIDETIDYIMEKKCSVSRFGDGELKIVSGEGIRFQKYDERLSARMQKILRSRDKACLVCLTDTFGNINWMVPKAYEYTWRILAQYRERWTAALDLDQDYGNAYITRFYIDRKDKSESGRLFGKLKKLWENEQIVFIEGEKSRLGYHNDLFDNAISIERLLGPAKNAFAYYDEILKEAKKIDKEKLILIALGPTATVLAYDLSKLGYRALDIGHVDIEYEWYRHGATDKIKIQGKYTSEADGGEFVSEDVDLEYQRQIIGRIGCDAKE